MWIANKISASRTLIVRAGEEFKYPSTVNRTKVIALLHKFYSAYRFPSRVPKLATDRDVKSIAVYDLNSNPHTFDFGFFLFSAEHYARGKGHDSSYLIIVKRTSVLQYYDETKDYSQSETDWRLTNILLPLISLYPYYSGYAVVADSSSITPWLEDNTIFPHGYSERFVPKWDYKSALNPDDPQNFSGLKTPEFAKSLIKEWIKSKACVDPIVTITLRTRQIDPARNSSIYDWCLFGEFLESKGFHPVFIPDTDRAWKVPKELEKFTFFPEGSLNLYLRSSLYEVAFLNYFKSSGTTTLALFNKKIRFISFQPILAESAYSNKEYWNGLDVTSDMERYSFSQPWQKIIWHEDDYQTLVSSFLDFLRQEA